MSDLTKEAKIKGIGTIYSIDAPFDKSLELMNSKGYEMISARDLAYARIKTGFNHSLMNEGSYVKEGSLYIPNSDTRRILVKNSLVLDQNLSEVANAHREGKEIYLPQELIQGIIEIAKTEDVNADAFLIKNRESIPTNRFNDDARTNWLFKDQAEAYGNFLKEEYGIAEMPFYLNNNDSGIDQHKQPFINQLWLGSRDYISWVSGSLRNLNCSSRVRGVARDKVVAEGDTRKKMTPLTESYTPNQIKKAMKALKIPGIKISGLENMLLDQLRGN